MSLVNGRDKPTLQPKPNKHHATRWGQHMPSNEREEHPDFSEESLESQGWRHVCELHRKQEEYARVTARVTIKFLRDTQQRQEAFKDKFLETWFQVYKVTEDHIPFAIKLVQATINEDLKQA